MLLGNPNVTFTSLPTLVTAVSISLVVPKICKSSSNKSTSCVPVSPSTVRFVANPVNPDPSPLKEPVKEPVNDEPVTCPKIPIDPDMSELPERSTPFKYAMVC